MKNVNPTAIFLLFIFGSCTPSQDKNYCKDVSLECEMQKEYVMFKVLEADTTYVDAYGHTLIEGVWYMHATQAGSILPFDQGVGGKSVTQSDLNLYVEGKNVISILEWMDHYKLDTIQNWVVRNKFHQPNGVVKKAAILESGGYFDFYRDGTVLNVTYRH